METVIITKDKEHIIATDAVIAEELQTGLDIKINIYLVADNPPSIDETLVVTSGQMIESVAKPGVYQIAWTPDTAGNYRIDIFEDTGLIDISTDFGLIKVTNTDIDNAFPGSGGLYLDFGSIQTFEQGSVVTLEMLVYDYQGGSLVDADALPTVSVIDSQGITSTTDFATQVSTGRYSFIFNSSKGAVLGRWHFLWAFTVASVLLPEADRDQFFNITALSCNPGADTRVGYAFGNPDEGDCTGTNFGQLITPDELRYVYGFGNEMVAPNGQTITDETLQWYIDSAIANVERDLNYYLKPRKIFHEDIQHGTVRDLEDEGLVTAEQREGVEYFRESAYDFNGKEFREFIYIKLKRRPIVEITKAVFVDLTGKTILDLLDFGMKPNKEKGSVEFFPNTGSLASLALISSNSVIFNNVLDARGKYPDAYYLDYIAGFQCAAQVHAQHRELITIIGKVAAINMLGDFGDGKSPGLASSSISLAGISESYATTQSATSAIFGAHILQLSKEVKEWYKENKSKYSGILFTAL